MTIMENTAGNPVIDEANRLAELQDAGGYTDNKPAPDRVIKDEMERFDNKTEDLDEAKKGILLVPIMPRPR